MRQATAGVEVDGLCDHHLDVPDVLFSHVPPPHSPRVSA